MHRSSSPHHLLPAPAHVHTQDMSKLTNLNALNISFNPMGRLPAVVPQLGSLLELNLDHTGACFVHANV